MPLAQIKLRTFIDLTDASTDAGAAHRELVGGQNQIIFYLRGQKPSSPLQKFNPDLSIPIFCSDNAAQCSVKTAPNCLLSRQQENSTPTFVTQRNVFFFLKLSQHRLMRSCLFIAVTQGSRQRPWGQSENSQCV